MIFFWIIIVYNNPGNRGRETCTFKGLLLAKRLYIGPLLVTGFFRSLEMFCENVRGKWPELVVVSPGDRINAYYGCFWCTCMLMWESVHVERNSHRPYTLCRYSQSTVWIQSGQKKIQSIFCTFTRLALVWNTHASTYNALHVPILTSHNYNWCVVRFFCPSEMETTVKTYRRRVVELFGRPRR